MRCRRIEGHHRGAYPHPEEFDEAQVGSPAEQRDPAFVVRRDNTATTPIDARLSWRTSFSSSAALCLAWAAR